MPDDAALEARARRAAQRNGYVAIKSRWRRDSIDNKGGFQIIEPLSNTVVAGLRFDLFAQDVIDWCEGVPEGTLIRR